MKLVILLALVLGVSSCAGAQPSMDGDWQLVSGELDGTPIPIVGDHRITLTIDGTQFGGRSACNHYGAEVSYGDRSLLGGISLRVGSLSTTEMACAPNVMESEAAYQQALQRVDSASRSGGRLVLSGPGVRLEYDELAPVPQSSMVGTRWVLESLVEGEVASSVQGEPALLELGADGSLSGSTGCRTLTGSYTISGDEVMATQLAAEGECPGELEQQDGHVVSVIGDGFTARIDGPVMTLESAGGLGLVYRAED